VMNPFEERNFIQPMGSAIMLLGCICFFFVLSFVFRVGRLEVGGQVLFLQAVFGCGEECPVST